MRITVKFSSLYRTLAGREQEVLEVAEGTTVDRISRILLQKYPDLPLGEKTYFIINDQVTTRDQILAEGDEVRVFQMLAGG